MIATLTFTLPEERDEYKYAMNGPALTLAASEFSNYLRSRLKYDELADGDRILLEMVRNRFHEDFEGLL